MKYFHVTCFDKNLIMVHADECLYNTKRNIAERVNNRFQTFAMILYRNVNDFICIAASEYVWSLTPHFPYIRNPLSEQK